MEVKAIESVDEMFESIRKEAEKVVLKLLAENQKLKSSIKAMVEQSEKNKKRLLTALKEQGFKVGPFVEGPDIRD